MSDTSIETKPSKQQPQSRLKQLTSGSSWVSPFRGQPDDEQNSSKKKTNLHKQLREDNKLDHIRVPAKFAHHPTLEAEAKKNKKQQQSTAKKTTPKTTTTKTAEKKPAAKEVKATDETKESADAVEKKLDDESKQLKITDGDAENVTGTTETNNTDTTKDVIDAEDAEDESKDVEEPLQGEAALIKDTEANNETNNETSNETSAVKQAEAAAEEHHEKFEKDIEEAKDEIKKTEEAKQEVLQGDDDIEKLAKQDSQEIAAPPQTKYEPVEAPNKATVEKLKDKPVLLKHYQELNAVALGSLAHDIDDPKKVIELGSGLRMTQEQLMEMAAKRVAPVITSINSEVSKTRQEDEIKRQQQLDQKVKKHEGKLKGEFDKYLGKLNKKKEAFNQEIEKKLANIENLKKTSIKTAEDFDKKTKKEIATAKKEFTEREEKAVTQHGTDKETLEKNHEELLATKKQELEDAKTGQDKATEEIEALQEKKTKLDNSNTELADEIEKLSAIVNEKNVKLDDLVSQYETHEKAIDSNLNQTKDLNDKIDVINKDLDEKKSTHKGLTAEVAALGAAIGAYTAKLSDLDSDKQDRTKRLADAKEKMTTWQADKDKLAEEAAREHERQRVQATQEYETRKHQEELERQRQKEEEERLAKEEEERQAKLKAEEEKRQAEEEERQAKLRAEEEERKRQEELKAKELKEKEKKSASVTAAIKEKEATQKDLEKERNQHDALFQKGSYEGEETNYQAAQKNRLRDEITNLQKIKDLREERATYTGEDPKSSELDTLIDERKKAIEKLNTKQAETKSTPKVSKSAEAPVGASIVGAGAVGAGAIGAGAVGAGGSGNANVANASSGFNLASVPQIPTAHSETAKDYNQKEIKSNYADPKASIPEFPQQKDKSNNTNNTNTTTTGGNVAALEAPVSKDITNEYNPKAQESNYSDPKASIPEFKQGNNKSNNTTTTTTTNVAALEAPVSKDIADNYNSKAINSNYADPKASIPTYEESENVNDKNSGKSGSGAKTAIGALTGGAIGAGAASAASGSNSAQQQSEPHKSNSLTDRFKNWGRRRSSKDSSSSSTNKDVEKAGKAGKAGKAEQTEKNKNAGIVSSSAASKNAEKTPATAAIVPKGDQTVGGVNARDVESSSQQPPQSKEAQKAPSIRDDSSYEVQSVYEVVTEAEYEAHKNNPDYLEVSEEEYRRHKQLEKQVNLVEKLS
ncbi:conserved hypothetical protein [Lodderomyces elongisporus NRRL YB-4239]|uniref:Uncharacterized protein n=1 Tax=Lodderomyces elongisporus (strain ATCC 11503 / CBS 2605 / JCM 1781 / NBRC 1676 / NRRL YB-4239) TaxID=379508 RepID=A5E0B3_LODEL|nr:conserved hypothetical protein [Lodderomyces elongisporus NRRL YB-4239]